MRSAVCHAKQTRKIFRVRRPLEDQSTWDLCARSTAMDVEQRGDTCAQGARKLIRDPPRRPQHCVLQGSDIFGREWRSPQHRQNLSTHICIFLKGHTSAPYTTVCQRVRNQKNNLRRRFERAPRISQASSASPTRTISPRTPNPVPEKDTKLQPLFPTGRTKDHGTPEPRGTSCHISRSLPGQ